MVVLAAQEARKNTQEGDDHALKLLANSQEQIKNIVRAIHADHIVVIHNLDFRPACRGCISK